MDEHPVHPFVSIVVKLVSKSHQKWHVRKYNIILQSIYSVKHQCLYCSVR